MVALDVTFENSERSVGATGKWEKPNEGITLYLPPGLGLEWIISYVEHVIEKKGR